MTWWGVLAVRRESRFWILCASAARADLRTTETEAKRIAASRNTFAQEHQTGWTYTAEPFGSLRRSGNAVLSYDEPPVVEDAAARVRPSGVDVHETLIVNAAAGFVRTTCEACGCVVIVQQDDRVPTVLCPPCGGGGACAAWQTAPETEAAAVRRNNALRDAGK